jgi:hypothetical protein
MAESTAILCALWSTSLVFHALVKVDAASRRRLSAAD